MRFPRRVRVRRCSSLSTSFVLAAPRALQVDSSCVSGADGLYRGNRELVPAGRVVGGVVVHQRIGDAGARCARAQAMMPPCLPRDFRPGFGGRVGQPQTDAKIDQRPEQRHPALTADGSVAAFAGRFVLRWRESRGPVDLPWTRPSARISQGGGIIGDPHHTPAGHRGDRRVWRPQLHSALKVVTPAHNNGADSTASSSPATWASAEASASMRVL